VARNAPIVSITSLKIVNSATGTPTVESTYASSDYIFQASTGKVRLTDSRFGRLSPDEFGTPSGAEWTDTPYFPKGFQNIQLVYVGGYSSIPADLTLAANQWIDVLLAQALVGIGTAGFEMERLGLYQYKNWTAGQRREMFINLFSEFRRPTL
jgi:hypothetical protein